MYGHVCLCELLHRVLQSALSDVGSMEMSLCMTAYRFLSAVAEKSRLTGICRQLLLSSGALHAALFASCIFPPSSGLRRLGLEVCDSMEGVDCTGSLIDLPCRSALQLLRNFRRKDLDDLSNHLKFHEKTGRTALTTTGIERLPH